MLFLRLIIQSELNIEIYNIITYILLFFILRKKNTIQTVQVKGILRPINIVFDIIRGTTGIQVIKIKKESFIKQAKKIASDTDTELFGNQDEYVKAVQLFVNAPNQRIMSASGILLLNGYIQAVISTRRRCIRYIQNPDNRDIVLKSKLDKPIIISGLPRTGSTMLYNLLACDPKSRAPRFFEISQMADPTPPVTSEQKRDNDPRIKKVIIH